MAGAADGGPVRVLIADDHPLFREALAGVIGAKPELELVATAANGRQALEKIRELEPDVAVVDLRMPELNGIELLKAVRAEDRRTKVLLCAAATHSEVVFECIAAGAAGYLDKGSGAEEICAGVVTVADGGTVISDRVEPGLLDQIRLRAAGRTARLTGREREVLALLAEGLSAPQIGARLGVEPSTVKTHLKNLYEKLGVSGRAAAVAVGMRQGLLE